MHRIRIYITCFFFATIAVAAVSCKNDGPVGTLELNPAVCVLPDYGTSGAVEFTAVNIVSVKIKASSIPGRWTAEANLTTHTLSVTAPAAPTTDEETQETETSGTVLLEGTDAHGHTITAELRVAIGRRVDLTSAPSNCYIVGQPNTLYSFDATRRGDSGETIPTASVELMWISATNVIRYLSYDEGVATFFLSGDKENVLIEANALIVAYDANDEAIWQWHIWVTAYDPSSENQTSARGDVFMTRNLGAAGNSNATRAAILSSYGLYYQWGRPTPFIGPAYYNCGSEIDHSLYDIRNYIHSTGLTYLASTAETGTMSYALANPMNYLLGTETTGFDWLYTAPNSELWAASKTVYDPCPRGWKVPDGEAFAGFTIADDHSAAQTAALREAYGWTLTDGTLTDRFQAAGRRSALEGYIQNLNTNDNPQPWIGGYWTTGTAGADAAAVGLSRTAQALYFTLNTDDASQSELNPAATFPRATGFNIRCVQE